MMTKNIYMTQKRLHYFKIL